MVVEHVFPFLRDGVEVDEDTEAVVTAYGAGEISHEALEAWDLERGAEDEEEGGGLREVVFCERTDDRRGGRRLVIEENRGTEEGGWRGGAFVESRAGGGCEGHQIKISSRNPTASIRGKRTSIQAV